MESSTATEGWQVSITHASETSQTLISTEDKPTAYIGEANNPQDRALESRLLERAKNILQYCGLIEGSTGLETALDQVRRRLRRQSEFI